MKFILPLFCLFAAGVSAFSQVGGIPQTGPVSAPGTNEVTAVTNTNVVFREEVLQLLTSGEQDAAESKLLQGLRSQPENLDLLFLASFLARSRFDIATASAGFFINLNKRPDSLEGRIAACVLAIDATGSKNPFFALPYYNALLILADEHPESLVLQWLTAVEARTLTSGAENKLPPALRTKILQYGVNTYEGILASMKPNIGPVLIHQTLGNMLEQLQDYDGALVHREKALWLERKPWSLDAAAITLDLLGRSKEALPLVQEAVDMDPQNPAYRSKLGSILLKLGRPEEAIKAWQEGYAISHLASYPYCISLVYRNKGDYPDALQSIRQALALEPQNQHYKIYEARYAALCGEPDASRKIKEVGSFDFEGKPLPPNNDPSMDPWFVAANTGDFHAIRKMLSIPDPAPGTQITISDKLRYRFFHEIRGLLSRLEQLKTIPALRISGSRLAQQIREKFRILDPSATNPRFYNQTALMIAAEDGWEQMANDLLQEGANLNQTDNNGDTALHYSIQFKQPRLAQLLLNASPDCTIQDKWHQTPLIMAAVENDVPSVRMLLEKNVDPNTGTPHGGTPLQYASANGELEIVNLLIKKGADVNLQAKNSGAFPLIVACRLGHTYLIKPLLSAGAGINQTDNSGNTPLSDSVVPDLKSSLTSLLVDDGASPTSSDSNGITPIMKARCLGYEELAKAWEQKSGTNTPLKLQSLLTNTTFTDQESRAVALTLPLLMESGSFSKGLLTLSVSKKEAIKELSENYGIRTPEYLLKLVHSMDRYDPNAKDTSTTNSQPSAVVIADLLKTALRQIKSSAPVQTQDDTAWIKSEMIRLTSLGMSAGYLSEEDGKALISKTTDELLKKYSSWNEYLQSFLTGARFHAGWSYHRYKNICDLILGSALPWPSQQSDKTSSPN